MQIKSKCCGTGVKKTRHANADSEVIVYQCHRCGNECEVQELLQEITAKIEEPKMCGNRDHWVNLILDGKCFSCDAMWEPAKPTFLYGDEIAKMEAIEDEQMKHREFPSDQEIDAMSEHYEKLTAML